MHHTKEHRISHVLKWEARIFGIGIFEPITEQSTIAGGACTIAGADGWDIVTVDCCVLIDTGPTGISRARPGGLDDLRT